MVILIDKIKSKKIRLFFCSVLIIFTIGNFFTETTFKQFLKERHVHKPDLKSVLLEINASPNTRVTLNLEQTYLSKKEISNSFENYLSNYPKIENLNIEYFNYLTLDQEEFSKQFWVICLNDLNGFDCELPKKFLDYQIISEKSFNSINVKFIMR